MEARIEAGERRPFMTHVAEEFFGQNGSMNRKQLNAFVIFQIHQNQRLQAQLFPIHVASNTPEEAEAKFRALVTGGPGWLPDRGQLFDFLTVWKLQDDEWMLIKASWQPVEEKDLLEL